MQSTGMSWPSDVGAEHGVHTGGASGAPALRICCADGILHMAALLSCLPVSAGKSQ